MQTKKQSLFESFINTISDYLLAIITQILVFPLFKNYLTRISWILLIVITPLAVIYASHVIWPPAVICPSGVIHCSFSRNAVGNN